MSSKEKKWKPKVEYRDPGTLTPYSKNAKVHSKKQIEKIAGAISAFGFTQPIVVDKDAVIIAGHGRREAALQLALKEVPVVVADHLTEDEVIAARIADNKVSEAPWDQNLLKFDLDTLKLHDFKLDLTGFELPDLKNFLESNEVAPQMFGGLPTATAEPLTAPNPIKHVTQNESEDDATEAVELRANLGDIFELGMHRLMCGDSTDDKNLSRLKNGVDIDLLLTDPPYGMNVVKVNGQIGGDRVGKNAWANSERWGAKAKTGTYKPIIGDDKPFDPTFLLSISKRQIIFGANHFSALLPTSPHWIVWYKDMPVGTDFSGAELAWTNVDKKAVKTYKFTWAGMTRQGNREDELTKRVHPTQKPVGLLENIINDYDPKNVMDLFGGSGSTLIACEKTQRSCYMMELDPHYCNVIIARWEKFTGQKAKLIEPCSIASPVS